MMLNLIETRGKSMFKRIINKVKNVYRTANGQKAILSKMQLLEEELAHIHAESRQLLALLRGESLLANSENRQTVTEDLILLGHHFRRNFLPNDDSAMQKNLMVSWSNKNRNEKIGYKELLESGFRVYSQNDEDGILLRIFSCVGTTNKYVIEIGSNCSGSDIEIPENLSTNLIVNHGWHGTIFEIDEVECSRMRYFFARHLSTKHFHWIKDGHHRYYSPQIVPKAVNPNNINSIVSESISLKEPDLMILDIDGGDYPVMQALNVIQPRVLVVEFEKRFRERFSVAQFDNKDFSKSWQQSGATSLPAWEKLLVNRGYILCAINSTGFNAFFIRADVAADKLIPLQSKEAFDLHPIFSSMKDDFWMIPDVTWQEV